MRTWSDIAIARSGDKGKNVNIGVIARCEKDYPLLEKQLTTEYISALFQEYDIWDIERYTLPHLHALNFVLINALENDLRTDAQGKAFAQALLQQPIEGEL